MKKILIVLIALVACGCQQVGPTQVGIIFRNLPPMVGGGLSSKVVEPGQLAMLMPWDTLYLLDTNVKDVSWPSTDKLEDKNRKEGFVSTRALDGNEVALAVTVRYRILPDPETLVHLIGSVAQSDAEVRELVASVARADIRAYMNKLRTAEFLDEQSRYGAIDNVRDSMSRRLRELGIGIDRVILDDFRFERLIEDGTVDASYQEKISEIQKLREDTVREKARIETVRAKKQQEFNQVQASINRSVAEAEGYKNQAEFRGNAYFEAKANEAQGIQALGKAEVEGLIQQVKALDGPGGKALLRLEIVKQLLSASPNFVVLNGEQSLQVQKLDTNQLLKQMGIIDAVSSSAANSDGAAKKPGLPPELKKVK